MWRDRTPTRPPLSAAELVLGGFGVLTIALLVLGALALLGGTCVAGGAL